MILGKFRFLKGTVEIEISIGSRSRRVEKKHPVNWLPIVIETVLSTNCPDDQNDHKSFSHNIMVIDE